MRIKLSWLQDLMMMFLRNNIRKNKVLEYIMKILYNEMITLLKEASTLISIQDELKEKGMFQKDS